VNVLHLVKGFLLKAGICHEKIERTFHRLSPCFEKCLAQDSTPGDENLYKNLWRGLELPFSGPSESLSTMLLTIRDGGGWKVNGVVTARWGMACIRIEAGVRTSFTKV